MTIVKTTEAGESNSVAIDKVVSFIKNEKEARAAEANTSEEAELTSIAYLLKDGNVFGRVEIPYLYPNMLAPIVFYEAKKHNLDTAVFCVEASVCLVNSPDARKSADTNKFSDLVREGKEGFYWGILLTEFKLNCKEYVMRIYPYAIDMLDKIVNWYDDKVCNIVIDYDEYRGAVKQHDLPGDTGNELMQSDPFATVFHQAERSILNPDNHFLFKGLDNIQTQVLDSVVDINDNDSFDFYEDIKTALGVTFQCL